MNLAFAGCLDGWVYAQMLITTTGNIRKADYYTLKAEVQAQIQEIYHSHNGVDGYRSMKVYLERKGELPKGLVLGLAAIITYYKGGVRADGAEIVPNDAPEIMNLLKELWATGCTQKVAEGVLAAESIWG